MAEREGFELEAISGRPSPLPKSRAKSRDLNMAEREGFEPSIQVLARITV